MATPTPKNKILIVAGRGVLPGLLAQTLQDRAVIIALEQFAEPDIQAQAVAEIRLGHFGSMIDIGLQHGANQVLFIGGLDRPNADNFSLDDYSRAHLDLSQLVEGDDAILRAIADLFAKGGLDVVGALDVAPELAAPKGQLTSVGADEAAMGSLQRGLTIARTLGELDVGQSVVVQQGLVLAVEGIEGTDTLIQRSSALIRPGPGPVLIKIAKPQQDMRLDIPTFGPQTIENLIQNSFSGAFIEARRTLFVNQAEVLQTADKAGLFIEGISL